MRVKTLVSILVIMLITAFTFAAKGKVNFSGEWSLNEEESDLPEGRRRGASATLTINQKGNDLSIERVYTRRSGEDFTSKESLTLDGKESENTTFRFPRKSVANWSKDGKSLTIASTTIFEREGNEFEMLRTETWSVKEKGKKLSIEYTVNSPRGERQGTLIYNTVKAKK